ncbi:MAG: alpha/beta hydrolase [Chitinophagaceae bacterium]|nr:alpha/beta hydrolase [Chitinophagaceae bacterium]MCA6514877.1 alpha/beta hydrolase [Chitinophagaceae bacterium]
MNTLFRKTVLLLGILSLGSLHAQLPQPSGGRVVRHEKFPSAYVAARNVDVWLPASYTPKKRYAVLYMQDGQMLFDSTITWNKQEWGVDEVITELVQQGKIQECIVVGIWNGDKSRHAEYFPQKPFESLSDADREKIYSGYRMGGQSIFNGISICSDQYLKFLVSELKPFIDSAYATRKDRAHTFLMGSSMGALISLYALCEYSDVFAGAACLSTHWPGLFSMDNNPVPGAFFVYLKKSLPSPGKHRIYFDHGTETLDAMYASLQKQVDSIMNNKGYGTSQWMSRNWPGQDHSERSWRSRLQVPLEFLLGK